MPAVLQQGAHPPRVRPGFQRNHRRRHPRELLPVRFRRGLYFPLATRLPGLVQDVVATASIAYIYADGELPRRLNLAILFHGRSPFALRVRSIIGSLTHPAGDRPSHPILCEKSAQCDFGQGEQRLE